MKSIFKKYLSKKNTDFIKNKILIYVKGYAKKSYSQEGEDMILRRIFENQNKGFYVDVGSHHPKLFSNTYFFYNIGWNGINIDAMPGSMSLFKKIRGRDLNIEKAISSKKQVLTYYSFNEPALNGFSKELSENNVLKGYRIECTKDIETYTLEEILDTYLPSNKIIDFLNVDVEGLDFDVIKSINFTKYRPKIILVEIFNKNFLGFTISDIIKSDICSYLISEDYTLFAKSLNTVIFKSNRF